MSVSVALEVNPCVSRATEDALHMSTTIWRFSCSENWQDLHSGQEKGFHSGAQALSLYF